MKQVIPPAPKRGRKPQYSKDKRVVELRKKGVSFRDIARLIGEHPKSTWRRHKRLTAHLSTGKI